MTVYSWQAILSSALVDLQQFANLANSDILLGQVFGADLETTALRQAWQRAEFLQLPALEVIASEQINGARGAYAASLNTLYLSQELLTSGDQALITSVFLEEYGHYLDSQFNGSDDTPGDEGEYFAKLVLGEPISAAELNRLQSEDDQAFVWLAGQLTVIEQNTINKITNNSTDDTTPVVSGNNVVWKGEEGIYFYDGVTTKLLSNNTGRNPKISGNNVIWESSGGISLYDGNSTSKLLNSDGSSSFSQIDGNNIVWQSSSSGYNYTQIFLYNGNTTINLTQTMPGTFKTGYGADISGNKVVWANYSIAELFLYNGQETIQLTNNLNVGYPKISGNNIIWNGSGKLSIYNGFQTTVLPSNYYNYGNDIDGNNVVWQEGSSNSTSSEIYFYNGSRVFNLTNNNRIDRNPKIAENGVVWEGFDGNDFEIYYYNGYETIQITNNNVDDIDAQISPNKYGHAIVWRGRDGEPTGGLGQTPDYEIFQTSIPTPLRLAGGLAQVAYVAYYGRPADPSGLSYWNSVLGNAGVSYAPRLGDGLTGSEPGAYNAIVNSFGSSAEANRILGGLNTTQKVSQVYQFLFNRPADQGGLNFWVPLIDSQQLSLASFALEVALGAQNDDIIAIKNKIFSADLFSNSIDIPAERQAYSGSTAETFGRNWLAGFGQTDSNQLQVNTALTQLVASAGL